MLLTILNSTKALGCDVILEFEALFFEEIVWMYAVLLVLPMIIEVNAAKS